MNNMNETPERRPAAPAAIQPSDRSYDMPPDFDAELQAMDDGPPLIGRWHHGNGVLVSGTIRIAQWDCDTNPPIEFRDRLLGWMCDTLNSALAAAQASDGIPRYDVDDLCARIKAADDSAADTGYMLDSNDCISVLRGTWTSPLANDCPTKPRVHESATAAR